MMEDLLFEVLSKSQYVWCAVNLFQIQISRRSLHLLSPALRHSHSDQEGIIVGVRVIRKALLFKLTAD